MHACISAVHKKYDTREPGLFKEGFCILNCFACAAGRFAAMMVRLINSNLVAEDSSKEFSENFGD